MFPHTESMRSSFEDCLRACENAERTCFEALFQSAERGGLHADPEHLRLLMDCSRVCARTAALLRRGWWERDAMCRECAELCEACAADCVAFDDRALRACTENCWRCARACRVLMAEPVLAGEPDQNDAA